MKLNYIRFLTGENDDAYYKRPYIVGCFNALSQHFDLNVVDVKLELSDEMINKSSWLKLMLKEKQRDGWTNWLGISDYYRLYVINQYDNIIYCDTDNLFRKSDLVELENHINNFNEFIINGYTGAGIYNKYKNNELYNDFIKYYDEVGEYYLQHFKDYKFSEHIDSIMTEGYFKRKQINIFETLNTFHLNLYRSFFSKEANVYITYENDFINNFFKKITILYIYKTEINIHLSAISLKYSYCGNPRKIIYTDNPYEADIILILKTNKVL